MIGAVCYPPFTVINQHDFARVYSWRFWEKCFNPLFDVAYFSYRQALVGVSRLVASNLFDTWVCGTRSRAAGPSASTCQPSPDPKTGEDASSTASIDYLLGGISAKARPNLSAA